MERLVVALDGPGSSGKSSVGAAAAQIVGYRFFDTGLLYRALTWLAEHRGVSVDDAEGLVALVADLGLAADATGRLSRIVVDGTDHTADVRAPAVEAAVSSVSAVPEVREALLDRQRELAHDGGIVMAGRDYRHGRASRRRPQGLPRRIGRGACPTRARSSGASTPVDRRAGDPGSAAPSRPARQHTRGRAAAHRARCADHHDGRQHLRQTVSAVVGAIEDAEARLEPARSPR
jgi:hypothetical protein